MRHTNWNGSQMIICYVVSSASVGFNLFYLYINITLTSWMVPVIGILLFNTCCSTFPDDLLTEVI